MKTQLVCGTLLSCLALQMSCSDENTKENNVSLSENLSNVEISVDALYSSHHTISQSNAEKLALDAANLLLDGNDSGLKSGSSRSVGSTSVMLTPQSSLKSAKAVQPDTLAYIVNFANGQGYAMVSADDRSVTKVLACIESGSYNADSVMNKPGVSDMFRDAQQTIVNDIDNFETYKEQAKKYCDANGKPSLKAGYTRKVTYTSGPYLNNRWGQERSSSGVYYNQYCNKCGTNGCNNTSVVGCTQLSIAQIMSYYKKPERLGSNGLLLNWDKITAAPSIDELTYWGQYFLQRLLGSVQEYNKPAISSYGCNTHHGTYANLSNSPAIEKFGYEMTTFPDNACKEIFEKLSSLHAPLIITDCDHAWVADGYKVITTLNITLVMNSKGQVVGTRSNVTSTDKYIHHNWGWYGQDNGYYALGGTIYTYNSLDGKYDENCYAGEEYTSFERRYIHYLRPKQ